MFYVKKLQTTQPHAKLHTKNLLHVIRDLPTFRFVEHSGPISIKIPAPSSPRTYGAFGERSYMPCRAINSAKLIPVAFMFTSNSPFLGEGIGLSSTFILSTPPNPVPIRVLEVFFNSEKSLFLLITISYLERTVRWTTPVICGLNKFNAAIYLAQCIVDSIDVVIAS